MQKRRIYSINIHICRDLSNKMRKTGERTNEKDDKMRKDKGEMGNDKGERRHGDGGRKTKKKKRLPARNTTAESLSSIISFLKNSQTISCRKQANLSLAESEQT